MEIKPENFTQTDPIINELHLPSDRNYSDRIEELHSMKKLAEELKSSPDKLKEERAWIEKRIEDAKELLEKAQTEGKYPRKIAQQDFDYLSDKFDILDFYLKESNA